MVTPYYIYKLLLLLLGACISLGAAAQIKQQPNGTGSLHPDFQTITTEVNGDRLAVPVINLDSHDILTIGFDALREDRDYLRYSISHCNADWTNSQLIDSELFDGFNLGDVEDYEFSRSTITHYVHYTITLPNKDFQFRVSGNYLLKVFPENEPDDVLLQVRFMVSEGAVRLGGDVTTITDIDFNSHNQQLQVVADLNRFPVRDAFNDLILCITQNGRLDNQVYMRHPSRLTGQRIVYEHFPELIFPAGNEYRRFETVQTSYPGLGIDDIEFHAPLYHHFVATDAPRNEGNYRFDRTQHGRFFIREYNSTNSDTEADYTVVHFALASPLLEDYEIYLDGDFTHRHLDDNSRMLYDAEAGLYYRAYLLKQGAYNYQYLAVPKTAGKRRQSLTAPIEGDFYETDNEYLLTLYYREPGARHDRLLSVTLLRPN